MVSSFEHLGVAGAVELHHLLNVLIDEVELAVDALKSGKTLALSKAEIRLCTFVCSVQWPLPCCANGPVKVTKNHSHGVAVHGVVSLSNGDVQSCRWCLDRPGTSV